MDQDPDEDDKVEVEPPDEIISSPASKLNIYRSNPNIQKVDNIKVTTKHFEGKSILNDCIGQVVRGAHTAITWSVSSSFIRYISFSILNIKQ